MPLQPLPEKGSCEILNKSEEEILQELVNQNDISVKTIVPSMLNWSSQYGIITDWHINSMVISVMSSVPYLRNVEFEIDRNNRHIKCTTHLGLISLLLKSRIRKLDNRIYEVINIYAPGYTTEISYRYSKVNSRT